MKMLLESIIVIVPDLQYLRARYYDPNMGRFMQQDTLFGEMERPLTQNLYIYCLNNGVNLRDPSGNSSVAELQAQYDRAQRAGAGQSVLDGIKSAMERARKAESKPTPKPTTKPPKKPDWGDTSNPYNPVNNPNSAGSILSGADGYWSNGGSSSSGGGYAPTQEDAMREAEAAAKNKKYAEEYRKKIESLIGGNKSWDRGTILLFNPNQIYNQFDYPEYLGKIGCSITTIAMGEAYMLGKSNPPVRYNEDDEYKAIPRFDMEKGLSGWGKNTTEYEPYPTLNNAYNTMASEIKQKRPVIVRVQGTTADHYVLTVGAKEQGSGVNGQHTRDDFIIMDTFAKTSKYNNGEPQLDQLKLLSSTKNRLSDPNNIRIFTFEKMDGMAPNRDRRSITLW